MIRPVILGRGNAGLAIAKALAILNVMEPELEIAPVQWCRRGEGLQVPAGGGTPVLCVANPHALHARGLLEGAQAGFAGLLCEKPLCLTLEEARSLRAVQAPMAVLHGYRQMWGPQQMRQMLAAGELGDWIAVEGRYWQSSAAQRAGQPASASWKNDVALSGTSDVLVDLGSHWIDLMLFLLGPPAGGQVWCSYANAEAPHRDTHVHLSLEYGGRRAFGSVSKTVHGATNELEVQIVGSRQAVAWSFLRPDEIVIGNGRARRVLTRDTSVLGSRQAPYHALGWLEGYVEITRQLLYAALGRPAESYPDAAAGLKVIETLQALTPS